MVRLQIQLEASRHRDLKRRAKRLGVSVSEVIRRCVETQLRDDEPDDPDRRAGRALAVSGRHTDPAGDTHVAVSHDAALADAFRTPGRGDERRR